MNPTKEEIEEALRRADGDCMAVGETRIDRQILAAAYREAIKSRDFWKEAYENDV